MNIQKFCGENADQASQTVDFCINQMHSYQLGLYKDLIVKGFNDPASISTISDVWTRIEAFFYLPGNLIIFALAHSISAHDFFEIQETTFNGEGALAISAFLYLITGFVIYVAITEG